MRWHLQIPNDPGHPHEAVVAGLQAIGLQESRPGSSKSEPYVLVTWSPWLDGHRDRLMREWPGPVIVVENGWLQPINGKPYWSVCLWGWNGTGVWRWENDGGERFNNQTRGWRERRWAPMMAHDDPNGPLVVVEQRGHPTDPRTMPRAWFVTTRERLSGFIDLRLKCDPEPIDEYLVRLKPRGVLTWSSAVASWALVLGIPVAYAGPSIWCWELATRWNGHGEPTLRLPGYSYRKEVFSRLAWSQWDEEELASGRPFKRLLFP